LKKAALRGGTTPRLGGSKRFFERRNAVEGRVGKHKEELDDVLPGWRRDYDERQEKVKKRKKAKKGKRKDACY
jgi:hypothetical protein